MDRLPLDDRSIRRPQGGWVDESTPLTPSTKRGQHRVVAEAAWQGTCRKKVSKPAYFSPCRYLRTRPWPLCQGPKRHRAAHHKARSGLSAASMSTISPRSSPPHSANPIQAPSTISATIILPLLKTLSNMPPGCSACPSRPPRIGTRAEMTPMARSFYAESKKVRNDRIKTDLGIKLKYPDYRTGLQALLEERTSLIIPEISPPETLASDFRQEDRVSRPAAGNIRNAQHIQNLGHDIPGIQRRQRHTCPRGWPDR